MVARGLQLPEGQNAGERLGLVRRELLDHDDVGLGCLDEIRERVGVGRAVGEIRGQNPEAEAAHAAGAPATTGGIRSSHGAADSNAAAARSTAAS